MSFSSNVFLFCQVVLDLANLSWVVHVNMIIVGGTACFSGVVTQVKNASLYITVSWLTNHLPMPRWLFPDFKVWNVYSGSQFHSMIEIICGFPCNISHTCLITSTRFIKYIGHWSPMCWDHLLRWIELYIILQMVIFLCGISECCYEDEKFFWNQRQIRLFTIN